MEKVGFRVLVQRGGLGVLSSESSLASNRFILLSNWAVNWANCSDIVFSRASCGLSMDDSG